MKNLLVKGSGVSPDCSPSLAAGGGTNNLHMALTK